MPLTAPQQNCHMGSATRLRFSVFWADSCRGQSLFVEDQPVEGNWCDYVTLLSDVASALREPGGLDAEALRAFAAGGWLNGERRWLGPRRRSEGPL